MTSGITWRTTGVGLALFFASSVCLAVETFSSRLFNETALIFRHSDLKNQGLPSRIHGRDLPLVFSSQIKLACLGVHTGREGILVFLPQSNHCLTLGDLRVSHIPGATDTSRHFADIEQERLQIVAQLEKNTLIVMQPQMSTVSVAGTCGCPNNQAPVVSVESGSPQEALAGTSISSIEFSSTDVDSEVLTEDFSYSLDGGGQIAGLPGGLSSNCTQGTGTLDCSVTGAAPLVTGNYLVRLTVIDGLDSGFANASLTVTSGDQGDHIFADGFENGL